MQNRLPGVLGMFRNEPWNLNVTDISEMINSYVNEPQGLDS